LSEIRIAIQTAKASTHVDSQGCIVGPPRLTKIAFYMSKGFAESALLIDSSVHSSSEIRIAIQTAEASTHVDPQGCTVWPPVVARIHTYMYKSFVESTVLIGLMLLTIDCDLHRHSQRPFATTAATPLALKEASSGHRHWPKYLSICIKALQKAPY
jgi:hypothetical protein